MTRKELVHLLYLVLIFIFVAIIYAASKKFNGRNERPFIKFAAYGPIFIYSLIQFYGRLGIDSDTGGYGLIFFLYLSPIIIVTSIIILIWILKNIHYLRKQLSTFPKDLKLLSLIYMIASFSLILAILYGQWEAVILVERFNFKDVWLLVSMLGLALTNNQLTQSIYTPSPSTTKHSRRNMTQTLMIALILIAIPIIYLFMNQFTNQQMTKNFQNLLQKNYSKDGIHDTIDVQSVENHDQSLYSVNFKIKNQASYIDGIATIQKNYNNAFELTKSTLVPPDWDPKIMLQAPIHQANTRDDLSKLQFAVSEVFNRHKIKVEYQPIKDQYNNDSQAYFAYNINTDKVWLEQQLNANRQSSNKNKQAFYGYGGLKLDELIQHEVIIPSLVMTVLEEDSYDVSQNKLDQMIGEKVPLEKPFTGQIHVCLMNKSSNRVNRIEILHIQKNKIIKRFFSQSLLHNIVSPHRLDVHEDYDRLMEKDWPQNENK